MKKNSIMLVAFLFVFLCSCQVNPDSQIVAGKDKEQIQEMIEKVVVPEKVDEEDSTMNEWTFEKSDYVIPDRMECVIESDSIGAKTSVKVDADIVIPENTLPVARTLPKKITFEQVNNIINLLANSNNMYYKLFAESIFTKNKLQQQIDYYMNEIASCSEEMGTQKTNYQIYVNELYEKMAGAPESYNDIQLKDINNTDVSEDMLNPIIITEENFDKKKYNMVVGEKFYNDELSIHALDLTKQQFIRYTKGISSNNKTLIMLSDLSLMKESEFTIEEALEQADIFVNALDSELKIESYGSLIEREYIIGETVKWKDTPSGYVLIYTRQANGVNINYTDGTDMLKIYNQDIFAESYSQEFLKIALTKEGVASLEYYCPMTINEVIGRETELMSFNEIQNKFKEYIVLNGLEDSTEVYVKINEIKLGLMRIAQPNNPDEYLLVPVWDFYGGSIRPSNGGKLSNEQKEQLIVTFGRSYITINAIDGSIIDRSLGY